MAMAYSAVPSSASEVAVTITLTSLASSATAGREGVLVDNTSNLFVDLNWYFKSKAAAGTPANDKAIYLYLTGNQGGTTYPCGLAGADAAITPQNADNLQGPMVLYYDTSNVSRDKFFGGCAYLWGGQLPPKVLNFVRNFMGFSLTAVGGDHVLSYVGVYNQGV